VVAASVVVVVDAYDADFLVYCYLANKFLKILLDVV